MRHCARTQREDLPVCGSGNDIGASVARSTAGKLTNLICEGFEIVLPLHVGQSFRAVPTTPMKTRCAIVGHRDLIAEFLCCSRVVVQGVNKGVYGCASNCFIAGIFISDGDRAHGTFP